MDQLRSIYDLISWWMLAIVIILILMLIVIIVLRKKSEGAMIIGNRGGASPFWWFLGGRLPGETGKGWDAFSGESTNGSENDGPGGGSGGSW